MRLAFATPTHHCCTLTPHPHAPQWCVECTSDVKRNRWAILSTHFDERHGGAHSLGNDMCDCVFGLGGFVVVAFPISPIRMKHSGIQLRVPINHNSLVASFFFGKPLMERANQGRNVYNILEVCQFPSFDEIRR